MSPKRQHQVEVEGHIYRGTTKVGIDSSKDVHVKQPSNLQHDVDASLSRKDHTSIFPSVSIAWPDDDRTPEARPTTRSSHRVELPITVSNAGKGTQISRTLPPSNESRADEAHELERNGLTNGLANA